MKRLIVRIVMIAAWIAGAGFTYTNLESNNYSGLGWSVPLALLGLAYFVLNIIWSERKTNINKVI